MWTVDEPSDEEQRDYVLVRVGLLQRPTTGQISYIWYVSELERNLRRKKAALTAEAAAAAGSYCGKSSNAY